MRELSTGSMLFFFFFFIGEKFVSPRDRSTGFPPRDVIRTNWKRRIFPPPLCCS